MAGYTKLFNSILQSTIWRADDKTRIVWITLLAMADKNGVAETSIPSLADSARVSLEDCLASLEKLKSPEIYSRTKEHEGRRVEECDGGFLILNHAKYRAKMSADERREYNRIKQAEWRETNVKPSSNNVNDSQSESKISALSAHTEAKADSEAVKKAFEEFWILYPRKVAKPKAFDAFVKAIKKARLETILVAVRAGLKSDSWRKEGGQFIPHPTTWLNQERWADEGIKINSAACKLTPPTELAVLTYCRDKNCAGSDLESRYVEFCRTWHRSWAHKGWKQNGRTLDWRVQFSADFAGQRK